MLAESSGAPSWRPAKRAEKREAEWVGDEGWRMWGIIFVVKFGFLVMLAGGKRWKMKAIQTKRQHRTATSTIREPVLDFMTLVCFSGELFVLPKA